MTPTNQAEAPAKNSGAKRWAEPQMRFTEIRHRWRFSLVAGALRVWGATIRLSAFSHILNVRSYRFHRSLAMRR